MKIGIWGSGVVGQATGKALEPQFKVIYYDKYKKKFNKNRSKMSECDIIFICVPTPMKSTGECDTSIVENSAKEINDIARKGTICVIKSTCVPGTTRRLASKYVNLNFVFNPEFLREKYAYKDAKNTNRIVIGANSLEIYHIVSRMYKKIFPKAHYFYVTWEEAEFVKYFANVMLAGQIGLANEIYQICQKSKLDYNKLVNIVLLDQRIGRNIMVPGHDGYLGFGGKCFPKDLNAFIAYARKVGYNPKILQEVWKLNTKVREVKDW